MTFLASSLYLQVPAATPSCAYPPPLKGCKMKFDSGRFMRSIAAPAMVAGALLASGHAAFAQTAAPTGVRGTISALTGEPVTWPSKAGYDVHLQLDGGSSY